MKNRLAKLLPEEAFALLAIARGYRAQGSLEYIMMLAAASIVIVIALAMIIKLRGAVATGVEINGSNSSVASAISSQLSVLSSNAL